MLSAHKILPPDVTFKENALTEPIQWHVEPVRDAQEESSGSSFLAQEHITAIPRNKPPLVADGDKTRGDLLRK